MHGPKKTEINRLSFSSVCRKLVFSWLLAALVEYAKLPSESRGLASAECLENMSFVSVAGTMAVCFVLLCIAGIFTGTEKAEQGGIFLTFIMLASLSVCSSPALPFFLCLALIFVAVGVYASGGRDGIIKLVRHRRFPVCLTVSLTFALFVFISLWTVARVRTFSAPTYDMGIFSQMFYNMKESGLPNTTLERDGLLSHFAVHVSPVYYLFLPMYFVFPYPGTLQILQAGVMASAIVPLWKICKAHGFSDWLSCLVCGILVFYPAFSGGAGYDIHENCFLTLFLLWLFYCIEKKRYISAFIFAILTLCVKEDAAVYVCIVGLWFFFNALLRGEKTQRKNALIFCAAVVAVSLGWFFAVTAFLSSSGDGVMTYRYSNFMYGGSSSLLTVVKAVVMNPMKAVYECVESEKLKYIGLTLLPLAGLPLFTGKYERYILLIPYLLVNLMSDYQYQHDIFFQYSFGSTAFLMYLTVINLGDIRSEWRRIILSAAALAVGAGCFFAVVAPKAVIHPKAAIERREHYRDIRACLEQVPENASVAATTFYTVPLSSRKVIYDINYCSKEHFRKSEYIVVDPTDLSSLKKYVPKDSEAVFERFEALLFAEGYEKICSYGGRIAVYAKQ
ncbi:MAG: DUF2079 domain-containing protein [Clostridia bacterium]|nr:DUF2079 domain-containing protein [Clostridia bacterium]